MKKNRLSHSAVSRYQMCGKSYEFHYKKKIRPINTSGALIAGDAMDNALNVLLVPNEKGETPEEVFLRKMTNANVNNQWIKVKRATNIVYAETDYDADLLTTGDVAELVEAYGESWEEQRKKIKDRKKIYGWDNLSKEDKQLYNHCNWLSVVRKGYLMLEAYRKKILPKIEKVHEVQRFVKLENKEGDSVIGYVDLIADIKGEGTVILDHKTSARKYEEDSVLSSPQLALYTFLLEKEYNTRKAGYLVLYKTIAKNKVKTCQVCGTVNTSTHKTCNEKNEEGKRCGGDFDIVMSPEASTDIIISEVPEITKEIVVENFDEINHSIHLGVFPRNFASCDNWYGGKCPYYDLCFKNKMTGLEDQGDKDGNSV